ncbi:MAG TPA: YfhO family protein [Bacteroidales bacterium]|nr:MAG: Bacterial membrane protein YfhO [Bacteroidetes bacterium ADurb.Bin217]HPM12894.1 YfhO family protein [Bacteroidales bacterium]
MKTFNFKPLIQSVAIIALFFVSILVYFSPIFENKQLSSHDVMQYKGMSKEITDFKEKTGEQTLWTNSMFSGMPAYLIHTSYDNLTTFIHRIFNTSHETPYMIAFMYFLGFFLALLLLNVPLWLSMLGALFYGFSSYFFIIIEAGHITKAIALGYMPLVIAGVIAAYRSKLLLGTIVFSLFLALQILINHLQITYYTMLMLIVFVGFQAYDAIRAKAIMQQFVKPSAFLLVGALLAVAANFGSLYMTYDYGKDSMRGKSELTHDKENKTKGLDKDYATAWSYGKDETFNLFIPNFKGGASNGSLTEDSETYKTLKQNNVPRANQVIKNMPLYWGEQSSTSGPVYIGAIVVFLFIFGLLYVQGSIKWWLLTITIFSILLAWGRNFMGLTDLFLDHFPGYNKFRTVSMILIIAQFAMPLLAVFALKRFFTDEDSRAEAFKKLKISLAVTGGLLLILLVTVGGIYDFSGQYDTQMLPEWILDALRNDRKSMLYGDIWRTLFFVCATFGVLTAVYYKKLKVIVAIAIIAVLTYMDMWGVNKRYLNEQDFVAKRSVNNPFPKTAADVQILADKDPNFRVMNLTVSPFNDAGTSYYHKSIGGYHGAKMKRYQELIDFHLSKMNMNVYNMLNTKYFIVEPPKSNPNEQAQQPIAQLNPEALGNAWFVTNISIVPNADAEIAALEKFNPKIQAFVDVRYKDLLSDTVFNVDSLSVISLQSYAPNHLVYTSKSSKKGVAVFSEIFYDKGWNAYIDGKQVPHFRTNYVLRGLEIPEGEHTIDFKFEPTMYTVGNTISLVGSLLLILALLAILFFETKKFIAQQSTQTKVD